MDQVPEEAKVSIKKSKKNKKQQFEKEQPQQPENVPVPEQLPTETSDFEAFQDNSRIINLGSWSKRISTQSNPPLLKIDRQFKDNEYPLGQILNYSQPFNAERAIKPQFKQKDKDCERPLQYLRKAAEVQRQVRKYGQRIIAPGKKLIDICNEIEELNRKIVDEKDLDQGIAFPTGISLNHCAAHYTPNSGDETILGYDDVCKIDFGTHVQGRIIDTAFTVAFNPKYQNLLKSAQEATEEGVNQAGIDVRLSDVGAAIQEVMESYEVELDGKTYPIKAVKNLCGHSIEPYRIHAGKSVPIVKNSGIQGKMEENEQYAIETFASTGKGFIMEVGECSHYMREFGAVKPFLRNPQEKSLFNFINSKFGSLAFCRKWLDQLGQTNHYQALEGLVQKGIIVEYPPLCDIEGSYVAQYEHTIYLKPSGKEVLSRGEDY